MLEGEGVEGERETVIAGREGGQSQQIDIDTDTEGEHHHRTNNIN